MVGWIGLDCSLKVQPTPEQCGLDLKLNAQGELARRSLRTRPPSPLKKWLALLLCD